MGSVLCMLNYLNIFGDSIASCIILLWIFRDFGESRMDNLGLFGSNKSTGGVRHSSQRCCWIFGARGLDGGDRLQAIYTRLDRLSLVTILLFRTQFLLNKS